MPLSEYFKGSGAKVMRNMVKQYGEEKGKRVFYATANKDNQNPKDSEVKKSMKAAMRKKGKK
jgi:hypothetical protein